MKKIKLSAEEQAIENEIETYVPLSKKEKAKIDSIISSSKKVSVTLRLDANDLEQAKRAAEKEGLPYQTFISSVLHRFLNGTLVDEKSIRKTLSLLSGKN